MREAIPGRHEDSVLDAARTQRPATDEARRALGLTPVAASTTRWADKPDGKRSHLRALLGQLDVAIAALRPTSTPPGIDAAADALRELTATLDLGAEPLVVACPVCSKLGMRGATSCGFCWASLRAPD